MRKIGRFVFLFFLLSACGTSIDAKPTQQVQSTQVPNTVFTPTLTAKPTSTADELKAAYGGAPFCQVAPEKARLGSIVNISAFDLPANQPISVVIYSSYRIIQVLPNTILTDGNGYVNIDITIPTNISTEEWSRIAI